MDLLRLCKGGIKIHSRMTHILGLFSSLSNATYQAMEKFQCKYFTLFVIKKFETINFGNPIGIFLF